MSAAPASPALAARAQRLAISATAAMLHLAAEMRVQGKELIDFGVGEPDFPTPDHIKQSAIAAIENNVTRYTAIAGTRELRQTIAAAHTRDFGSGYVPAEVLATIGGKQALFESLCLIVDHGDEVLIPAPYWVSYPDIVRYAGGVPVFVPSDESSGFALDLSRLERAITPRTKAVILNSPSNPSGAVVSPDACRGLLALCRDRGLWLLSDECYAKLVYNAPPYSVAGEPGPKPNLVILGSLSKTYSMTGWRLGYALGPEPFIRAMEKLQSQSTSNATTFVQKAAVEALAASQDFILDRLAQFQRRRDLIVTGLRAVPGVTCTLPAGAFYAFPNLAPRLAANGLTPTEFSTRLLREAGVVTVPGEAFGGSSHIRFSYATSDATILEGLRRFGEFLSLLK